MIDTLELKAQIVRQGMNQQEVYEQIGLKKQKWYRCLKEKRFNSDEIFSLCKVLNIDDPMPIFFADEVACKRQGGDNAGDSNNDNR